MKILHTSDLHLGLTLNNVSFIQDQSFIINSLIDIIRDNDIDVVLICGDVFDRAISSAAAISLYDDMCTRICIDLNIPLLICAGNHDGAARLTSCSELLKRSGLYISGKISDDLKTVVIGDTAFHFMPYFNIDEARLMFPDSEIKTYTDAVRIVVDNIAIDENKRNILLAHLFVAGSVTCESDKTAIAGGSIAVPVDLFDKFDYTALGHLHKPQTIKNVRYSGTPLKYSFAEAEHIKSVTVIDSDNMKISTIDIKPMRDLRRIIGTYSEVTEIAESDINRDDYIKIELTDRFPSMTIDKQFEEIYPNLLQCTGKSYISEHSVLSVTADELSGMSVTDILARYCEEVAEIELDDELMDWFNEAAKEIIDRGDDI